MKLSLNLSPEKKQDLKLARQIGIRYAVTGGNEFGRDAPWEFTELKSIKKEFEKAGLTLIAYENLLPPDSWKKVILGRKGRDEEIERFHQGIRNMEKLDIPILSWNWDSFMWSRTSESIPSRGDSLVTGYDHDRVESKGSIDVDVTRDDLWENLEYFLNQVGPVAEKAGVKMSLHPDDPPLPSVRGIPRIIGNLKAIERVLDLYPSESHGITFCQANFSLMGLDIPSTIRRLGNRIKYIHFRDVEGTADSFKECWHDNGPTDMLEAMRAYNEIGFNGPIRPDHVPTMAGESNERPGYEMKGRIFAVGYIKGLIECVSNRS